MRKSVAEAFEDTLNGFLNATIAAMLGPRIRDEVYSILNTRGIATKYIATRFDDVVSVLGQTFGVLGAKVITYKVIAELHGEYSQPIDFSFQEALGDKLSSLRERVVSNHIWPIHLQDAESFFDKGSGSDTAEGGWAGLYRYKKGVNSNPRVELG